MAYTGPRKQAPSQPALELFAKQPEWPEDLIAWFQDHARDLPWRRNHDPYRVWLSEVMLQQTQVERVLLYFDRWLHVFPDIQAVAQAPMEAILSLWQGLGYYSRARNFHRAAKIVAQDHGGLVPQDFEDLLRLPGVGRYTAGAILAFAYNQPFPTIEANTERVYARLTDESGNLKQAPSHRLMEERLSDWIPSGKARLFNQALMELGSLVCMPRSPRCHLCPLANVCLARQRGTAEQRPVLPPRKSRIKVQNVALVAMRPDGAILLFQRPPQGLWAGFWELPDKSLSQTDAMTGKEDAPKQSPSKAGTWRRKRGQALTGLLQDIAPLLEGNEQKLISTPPLHLGRVRHSYTRYSAQVDCYLVRMTQSDEPTEPQHHGAAGQAHRNPTPQAHRSHRWASLDDIDALPLHAGHRKCLALVLAKLAQEHNQ